MTDLDLARALLLSDSDEDQRRGVELILNLEREGNLTARYALATWHMHGAQGFAVDLEKGLSLLASAADGLVPEALYDLAYATELHELAPQARRRAFGYYLAAALLGDTDALAEVYKCILSGHGVFRDAEVAEIVRKIALQKGVPAEDL